MRFCVRMLQAIALAGLIAVTAAAAEGQLKSTQSPPAKPVTSVPKSVLQNSPDVASRMARRLAGPGAKTVTVEDVVEGGVYYEDPVSGKLILGEAPSKVRQTPTRVAQAPVASHRASMKTSTKTSVEEVVPMEVTAEEFGDAYCEDGVCCEDGECGMCSSCLVPCGVLFPAGNLELFAGVQGFTGPANWDADGASFGFNEGLNWGMPIPLFSCLGGQIGFRATQSNLSGSAASDDTRRQAFVTAGLFRRVDVGLQGGVVVDWLSDGWYRDVDLVNLRSELSWVIDSTHEVGFWGAFGTKNSEEPAANAQVADWETTDLYAFFYRYSFGGCHDGDARLFAGFSGQSDGLLGADARLPLGDTWALEANFAYLIPSEGDGANADADYVQESWNVGINLVWYPGRRWGRGDRYYRPLFRVADNGVFMMDQTMP
ncbi:MAG: hypothetical protein GX575_10415 [Candidatus Anammoximicrobium sp.]|nr:hypothetical protein [Candidatus Anammoximicrobium sp.]